MKAWSMWIPILIFFFILFCLQKRNKNYIAKRISKKREDKKIMVELAKRFVGKECLIYTFNDSSVVLGIIKEVSKNALLIENDNTEMALNLDFVVKIREYPRNKKGKKKAIG